jgi:galactose mutarotase-like enzyme
MAGVSYTPARNDGENHLHAGSQGFNKRLWTAKEMSGAQPVLDLT